MRVRTVQCSVAFLLLHLATSGTVFADEREILTDKAREWRQANPKRNFVVMTDAQGKPVEVKSHFHHTGVESKSAAWRDDYAAKHLFEYGKTYHHDFTADPDHPLSRFAGVRYIRTDGAGSKSKNDLIHGREWQYWGDAVGVILIYP